MNSYICYYGDNSVLKAMTRSYKYIDLKAEPDYQFIPGDRYLIYDKEAYDVIVNHQKLHIGPRSEGFFELTKCPYMILRNGVVFRFRYLRYEYRKEWLTQDQYEMMLPNIENIRKKLKDAQLVHGISKKTGKPYYRIDFRDVAEMDQDTLKFLMDPNYVTKPPQVKHWKCIREISDIQKSFKYFINQDIGNRFGLDYETSGFPFDDKDFFHMGVGIADSKGICAYFDMEWMQTNSDKSNWNLFLKLYKEFLDKHGENVITYNVGFELRCTYLLFKRMYAFHDAGTINKLEGSVERYYSLKYTAMRYLGVASWDDDFEWLNNILYELMKPQKDEITGEMISEINYKSNSIWGEIKDRFPNQVAEFESLFKKYWGNQFKCIPSEILSRYCCQDSYYTLLLRSKSDELGYSDLAWDAFNANMRLGAHLEMNGAYIDKDLQQSFSLRNFNVAAYGGLNILKLWTGMKLKELGDFDLPEIPEITNLLKNNINFCDAKGICQKLINDEYEVGIDTNLASNYFSFEVIENILRILQNSVGKLKPEHFRRRTLFNDINQYLKSRWNYNITETAVEFNIDGNYYIINSNLDKILRKYGLIANRKRVEFLLEQMNPEVMSTTLIDYSDELYELRFNERNSSLPFSEFIKNLGTTKLHLMKHITVNEVYSYTTSIFNFNSPIQWKEFMVEYIDNSFNLYWASMEPELILEYFKNDKYPEKIPSYVFEKSDRGEYGKSLNVLMKFFKEFIDHHWDQITDFDVSNLKGNEETQAQYKKQYELLIKSYDQYKLDGKYLTLLFSWANCTELLTKLPFLVQKEIELIQPYLSILLDSITRGDLHWHIGYVTYVSLRDLDWKRNGELKTNEVFAEGIPKWNVEDRNFKGLAKLGYCYRTVRKFMKLETTYVSGMLVGNHCLPYDENGVSIGRYGEGEAYKSFCRYMVCQKKSKRWSASFHTIPAYSEVKRIVTTPPGYLMSYFDIGGMEVRSIAYISQDKFLMESFETGKDPYIELSRTINPDKDDSFHWANRPDYKTTLLGSLYGMGEELLGGRIGKSTEEAAKILDDMFLHMYNVKKWADAQAEYANQTGGLVKTMWGDKLSLSNEPSDRWARLSNNLCIQGGSAIAMAYAFENIIQDSYDNPEGPIIRPMNVVHDSSQNYFQSQYIFDIAPHYKKRMADFLLDKIGIPYVFDTLVGVNYFDMSELKVIDENNLQLKGSYKALTSLCRKLKSDGVKFFIKSIKHKSDDIEYLIDGKVSPEFKKKGPDSLVGQFYFSGLNACYDLDESKFRMIISREEI